MRIIDRLVHAHVYTYDLKTHLKTPFLHKLEGYLIAACRHHYQLYPFFMKVHVGVTSD